MKEILTTAISNTVGLPLLGRTIDFIRDNVKEQTTSLAYSELNSSNDSLPIVLYGCIGTYSTVGFTNDTYTITKGAILYQGEIYQVPAMVATRANIGETIVFRIDSTTFQEGEPTLYTDGASRYTNLDRTIKIYNGLTGSGIVDAVNLRYLNRFSNVTNTVISSGFPTGCTVQSNQIVAIKKGNLIHINGSLSCTSTNSAIYAIYVTLHLQSAFEGSGMGVYTGSTGWNYGNYSALVGACNAGGDQIHVSVFNSVPVGNQFVIMYQFTMIADPAL